MQTRLPLQRALHPLHLFLLAGTVPLFLGALLSDVAYWNTYQVQWTNFASWLIAGGLLVGALALLCALIGLVRPWRRQRTHMAYIALLLLAWLLAFYNALVHAKDAWAAMPDGLVLSILATLLASAATALGFSTVRHGRLPAERRS